MWKSIVVIAGGGAAGALFRWMLGLKLNYLLPTFPMGTLAANLMGSYLVGVAIAYFAEVPTLSPEWRLLIITGFCGGLTTFSTFSAEVVTLFQQGRPLWAMGVIGMHLVGSLVMTAMGIISWNGFKFH